MRTHTNYMGFWFSQKVLGAASHLMLGKPFHSRQWKHAWGKFGPIPSPVRPPLRYSVPIHVSWLGGEFLGFPYKWRAGVWTYIAKGQRGCL